MTSQELQDLLDEFEASHKLATAAVLPGWGRPLGKLMNNCETDISFRGSCRRRAGSSGFQLGPHELCTAHNRYAFLRAE
jgi:hypothetical protein